MIVRDIRPLFALLALLVAADHGVAQPFRFVVISDSNDRYGSVAQGLGVERALAVIRRDVMPLLVVHNGDMVAGQSRRLTGAMVRAMWRGYHNAVTYPLRRAGVPLFPVPGNHDAAPSRRLPDREIYRQQWLEAVHQPQWKLLDAYRYPFAYSFSVGNLFFMVLDGAVGRVPERDLPWIRLSLEEARQYDQRVVFSHVPFAKLLERSYGALRPRSLYRLLLRHRAILFTGHYEVFYRGYYRRLPTVSTGQLSHSCRALIGTAICQGMSFVVVDVDALGQLTLTAIRGPHFAATLPTFTLPMEVGEFWRNPIEGSDFAELITPPELSMDLRTLFAE